MSARVALALAALVIICVACVSAPLLAPPPGPPWRSPLERGHALAGRIWDVADRRFLTSEEFIGRAAKSWFLLLGEKHDNPDHHLIQAWIVRGLLARERRPAVAFEMFSPDQRAALERQLASQPQDGAALAEAVGWAESGWPDFAIYQPLVETVLGGGLSVHPANLSRTERESLRERGTDALDRAFVERFGLDQPLPEEEYSALVEEIQLAHCGFAPLNALGGMIDVQRARDARMAQSLIQAVGVEGAVLVAGAGHARRDRGVPAYLVLEQPDAQILSLGLVEVESGADDPLEYVDMAGAGSFDCIWFTPRLDDLDPCEKFRGQLERLRKGPHAK